MSATNYEDLKNHVGHEIVCVDYVGQNVAIECITCSEVLMDYDEDGYEEDDGQPDDYTEQHDFAHDGFEDDISAADVL